MDNIFVIIKNKELICYTCTKDEANKIIDNIAKETIENLKEDKSSKVFRQDDLQDDGTILTTISYQIQGYLYAGQISVDTKIHYEEIINK